MLKLFMKLLYGRIAFLWFVLLPPIFTSGVAHAVYKKPLKIQKIVIKGHKIVRAKAVTAVLSLKKGGYYKKSAVRKDVRKIFNTGWFYDVLADWTKTSSTKGVLTYTVKEKPIVEKFIYKGNKSFSKKKLDEIFQFLPHDFLNHKKLQQSIKNLYLEYEKKGYYLVNISYVVKKTKYPEKVQLVVRIKENKKVKVKRVHFIGNKNISSKEIKKFIRTKPGGLFSFLSSAGSYSQEVLETDLNNIRFIYLDKGYWKSHVGSPDIFISPDRTAISITIPIHEGNQYRAGTMQFTGDSLFTNSELKEGLETEEGEVFSYSKFQKDIKKIQTRYGNKGYAFANVVPKFFAQPGDEKTMHVLFEIQKGKKVHIRKILIFGNTITKDKVVRREMRIFEGELYNENKKEQSLVNIKRLGFFEDAQILSKTIKGRDNLVDLEVTVKERERTGAIEISGSYNAYNKLSFSAKVNKSNVFGTGRTVGLDTNLNFNQQYFNINITDPYFLDTRWYVGGDFMWNRWNDTRRANKTLALCDQYIEAKNTHIHNVNTKAFNKPDDLLLSQQDVERRKQQCWNSLSGGTLYRGFSEQKVGGGITVGRSITDSLKLFFYYRLENIELSDSIDENLFPVKTASGLRNPIEFIVEYDLRNDRLWPTSGFYSRNSIAYDGLLGKFNYLTLSTNVRFYQPLIWKFVFRTNFQYNHHVNLTDNINSQVPFDRLFRLGGINNLRGFNFFTIGPKKRSQLLFDKALQYEHPYPHAAAKRVYGGDKAFYVNWELQAPLASATKVFGVLFIDMGVAYSDISTIDLRSNWGVGLRILTPMGPFRLELGFPFAPRFKQGEKTSNFNFTMGFPF